ncbi:MAG: hypothetical protein IKI75_09850 [Lachnospiraceae bacterium]|nr:hypothetical protein [Lachnospiraceae bacterium]
MLKKYKPDKRTAEDIEQRIGELAAGYVPEWNFSVKDPDIGSTISRIFARQMQDNIRTINHVTEIYHAEFVNFLDLTLKRAVPAGCIVCFNLVDSTISGTQVVKGTQITTESAAEEGPASFMPPVFETDRELYITSAKIKDIFMTDREDGTIIPLKGDFKPAKLLPELEIPEPERPDSPEEEEEKGVELKPFVLFGEGDNIGQHALAMMHPRIFDVEDEEILIDIKGSEELTRMISVGDIRFSWLAEGGLREFDDMSITGEGAFRLLKNDKCFKIETEAGEQSVVVLTSEKPVTEVIQVSDIRLASNGKARQADYVGDGNSEFKPDSFAPFSDVLSVFAECYIGKEDYFDKAGSVVTIDFHLSFMDHTMELTEEKVNEELKIIKRKARATNVEQVSDAYADEISIEYFNGIGWKYLNCDREYRELFASADTPGDFSLSFICPSDWAETENGSYHGRLLRLRLLRADNCYLRPAVHHYPVLTGLKIAYTYRGREMQPALLRSICGTEISDLTLKSRQKEPYNIFTPISYADDALYLGFDAPLEGGPVGMLFVVESATGRKGIDCTFEYSSRRGFRQLKVSDGTESFTHSGIIMFLPPSDMAARVLEGRRRYWLKIVRSDPESPNERQEFMTKIMDIRMNAVTVVNAVNGSEEDYYIEEATAYQKHFLGAGNILDADVWVNERASLSAEDMRQLAAEHSADVRLETDMIGNIRSCFVRWHEVDQFNEWDDGPGYGNRWDARRVYRIDRLTSEILFGDGIHSYIPSVTDDVAFRVKLRTSSGEAGNVGVGELSSLPSGIMFVDTVSNPVQAYGGGDMETVQEALMRGADRIYSRGRCVTENDYRRAILRFSGMIDKVSCIPGITVDGRTNAAELSFALLMKDHGEGSYSFHRLEAALKKYLLDICEITVAPHRLHIVEPIFVAVSVTAWIQVMDMDDSFEVQTGIKEILDSYLDPVNGGGEEHLGWEIGTMPKKTQILLQLAGLKNQALIRKTSVTVRYSDYQGEHEMDYEDLVPGPFMVVKSGTHTVNILYNDNKKES